MAKFSEDIKKPGGGLVSHKRPHGQRVLLPAEIEFCEVVSCSKEQYFYFLDQQALYNGKRSEGYELIPDIRNDVITSLITKEVLIQIGIAVAAATVSYLLTPKPREQKPGSSQRTADAIGNAKFAPQSTFDSVQELANVGDIIPLIFANSQEKSGYGGVRVNSQLLWSQFVSLGKFQQLKALNLFSLGAIDGEPDYQGYAIGDTLLNAYNAHKVGLYFRNGSNSGDNRIKSTDIYLDSKLSFDNGNDPFEIGIPDPRGGGLPPTISSKAFSGARNPTTQTRFGAYSPFPNAQVCRLPYELLRSARGADQSAIRNEERKRKKVEFAHWPTRCGFLSASNGGNKGSELKYQIIGTDSGEQQGLQRVYNQEDHNADAFNYRPHGVDDVDSMTTSIRENTDNLFAVGEQYLIGTAIAKCIKIDKPNPWTINTTKDYFFEVIEAGDLDIPVNNSLGTHTQNPVWFDPPGSNEDKSKLYSLNPTMQIFYQQLISGTELGYTRGTRDLYHGWDVYTGQRVAIATVSNNRKVDVTEIGIKSRVYKKIRFANIDSQPNEDALDKAWSERTQIQLGQIDRYISRIEFFMLQVRELGSDTWTDLKNGLDNHLGLFAIKGNNPQFQYNYVSIHHPDNTKQYEYRFKPYPGNFITRGGNWNKRVNLLKCASSGNQTINHYSSINQYGGFNISFSGDEAYYLNKDTEILSNPEWQIGETKQTINGAVIKAENNSSSFWQNNSQFNGIPTLQEWVTIENDIFTGNRTIAYWDSVTNPGNVGVGGYHWSIYWDKNGGQDAREHGGYDPGYGVTNWREVIFKLPNDPKRYIPSLDAQGNNPEGKYWLFYTDIQELRTTTPAPHYSGTVSVIGGSGHYGSLKVDLTVYRQSYLDGNNVSQYYYYASWNINSTYTGLDYRNGDVAFIPSESDVAGVGLPNRIQIKLEVGSREIQINERNLNPFDVVSDWNVYEGDENSNRNEPSHEIVYVNEILKPVGNNDDAAAQYSDLAFAGLRINSSKEWTNFSQFSAYFKKGIKVERLITTGTSASNLFPEIAYALLTNPDYGAGKLVGADSVDRAAMADAADFCKKNNFFWDGVISSKINLREFLFEHAGYCLLDFTIIGGRFSLKPSVPVNPQNVIDKNVPPKVVGLFTDGNIKDLKVSFLSPEERQLFRAVVLWRNENENGFPETKSILVSSTSGSVEDPIEKFDMSGFCSSYQQARNFACYAINTRRLVDHGVSFTTAPQYMEGISPGDYFKLVSEVTHTSRFRNGAISANGEIVSMDGLESSAGYPNNISIYFWKPGTVGVEPATLDTTNVSQSLYGSVFSVKNTTTEKKIYKCETISYGEEGLIEVSGSYAPVDENGNLAVMQNWDVGFDVVSD